jgi:uncharacterized protein (TIGR02611 family)
VPGVPGHRTAKRVVLETVGWLLVLAGVAALVLPGPGLLMLFGGMAILSQQYEWAERRLRPLEVRALRTAAESVQTWPRIVGSLFGVVWLTGLGVVWVMQPPPPSWWPGPEWLWLAGGWPTGVTLIASALIALGLIVFSFRKFRGAEKPDELAARVAAGTDEEDGRG